MISKGSCDTEDWSNDAENSEIVIIFHNITDLIYFTDFSWNKCSLGEHKCIIKASYNKTNNIQHISCELSLSVILQTIIKWLKNTVTQNHLFYFTIICIYSYMKKLHAYFSIN